MTDTVRHERSGRVATLTIDRPPLNILDVATLEALDARLAELASDEDLQAVVVTGGGERAFSAGVAVEDHTPDRIESMLETFHSGLRRLLDFPAPTIAAVRGHCLGGGMELAAACDLRLATASARFGQPEIELGCFPPFAAALYPTQLGRAAAFDLVLTGRIVNAAEVERLGFVSRVVPDEELDTTLAGLLDSLTSKSAAVTRLAVRAMRAREGRTLDEAVTVAEDLYTRDLVATADMDEGLAAFLEKRPPRWEHR